jgi:DNA-binding PadR family transcriptional regulator
MTKENYTKYIILGFLNYRPLSGYVIKKFVERSIAYFWNLSNGQIYPTLKRLQKEGLVTMQKQAGELGPDSKVYSLTEAGRDELDKWLSLPESEESFRSPMLLKIFFGGDSTKDVIISDLQEFLKHSQEKLAVMEIFEQNYKQIMEENQEHTFMYITVLRGKIWYSENIKWAKQSIRLIKSMKEQRSLDGFEYA